MKKTFKQAVDLTNSSLLFIPFLALIGIRSETGDFMFFSVIISIIWLLLDVALYPIVYGRSIETITNCQRSSWRKLWEAYWVDYILAMISIVTVTLVLTLLMPDHIAGLLVRCLAVYVFPLVFLSQKVLDSFHRGIMLVFQNLNSTCPLLMLVLFSYLINYIIDYSTFTLGIVSTKSTFGINYVQNLIAVYIHLVIFNAALIVLVDQKWWSDNKNNEKEMRFS